MLTTLFTVFFICLLIKVPIAFTMGLSALVAVLSQGMPLTTLITRMFVAVDSFPLMAIPFFILAGELMNAAELTNQILNLAKAFVGHIKGGLAMVNIWASVFFAGLSGSATADTAALGSLEIPMMVKDGYSKEFSVAVTVASSTVGPIIPPSIMLVMYAVIANVSISRILIAGFIPGVLMALFMSFYVYYISGKRGYGSAGKFSIHNCIIAIKEAILPMMMPIIIMGGILSGIFTATEAGVVATVYALIVGLFVRRTIKFKDLPEILLRAAGTTSVALLITAMASMFSWLLAWESFPSTVTSFMVGLTSSPTVIIFLILGFLIFLGLFVEGIPVLIVFAPILVPVINEFGIDPIFFGVILVITILVGSLTPPVGSLLYLGSSIGGTSVMETGKEVWPFVFMIICVIILSIMVPQLVLFLPNLLMGAA